MHGTSLINTGPVILQSDCRQQQEMEEQTAGHRWKIQSFINPKLRNILKKKKNKAKTPGTKARQMQVEFQSKEQKHSPQAQHWSSWMSSLCCEWCMFMTGVWHAWIYCTCAQECVSAPPGSPASVYLQTVMHVLSSSFVCKHFFHSVTYVVINIIVRMS